MPLEPVGLSTAQEHRERILTVFGHIQQHLDRDLSTDELARVAGLSEFHFHRIFGEIVGEPMAEYVRRLRLERAALALYYTDRPIKQIAGDVGYSSNEALTRAFTTHFGASPANYRARMAKPWGGSLAEVQYTPEETGGFVPFRLEERIQRIEVKEIPPMRVAYMRSLGPYKTALAETWMRFGKWLLDRGFAPIGQLKVNIALDNPDVTPPEKLRADVCIAVDDDFQPEGDVGVQIIPSGRYVIATHVGPWTLAGLAWHWMFNMWLPRSGYRYKLGQAFETFHCGPETPLEDWVLHIHIPIV